MQTPDAKWLYYCPLSTFKLYRIPTSFLLQLFDEEARSVNDYNNSEYLEIAENIEYLGLRSSQMDGMTFSNTSQLYYGWLEQNAIAVWHYNTENPSEYTVVNRVNHKGERSVYSNNVTMQWLDTLAWDDANGYLWWTTNRLHRYSLNNMAWNGTEGANLRIMKLKMDDNTSAHSTYSDTGLLLLLSLLRRS